MDVLLFQTPDGGDVRLDTGELVLSDGLETAVYLSLFGGNEQDSGLLGDASRQWWGNQSERLPECKLRSETQYLLRSLPLIPASLARFHDAALRDLDWMVGAVADEVTAELSMPALNTVQLTVRVRLGRDVQSFSFRSFR